MKKFNKKELFENGFTEGLDGVLYFRNCETHENDTCKFTLMITIEDLVYLTISEPVDDNPKSIRLFYIFDNIGIRNLIKCLSGADIKIKRQDIYTSKDISDVLCSYFSIQEEDYKRKTRKTPYVYYKQLYAYFMYNYTKTGCSTIGEMLKIDHATVLHCNKKIKRLISYTIRGNPVDSKVYNHVNEILNDLETKSKPKP